MQVRVSASHTGVYEHSTRIPFRFGAITLERVSRLVLTLAIDTGEGRFEGVASDLLVPKWFEKRADLSVEEDVRRLEASVREAVADAVGGTAESPFALWRRLYRDRVESLGPDHPERLLHGFGVAMVERAVIDGACRSAGLSLHGALVRDTLGFRPQEVLPQLAGWDIARDLPPAPAARIGVRHTVGMADPLRRGDVARPVDDGLPECLADDIGRYGLTRFKIKVGGDPDTDLQRLLAIQGVLDETGVVPDAVTLDGNEQYGDLERLGELLASLRDTEVGRRLADRLRFIEQPLPRAHTFDVTRDRIESAVGAIPLLIDEADAGIDSFPRALAVGYQGVSIKNCKGVFRALANRGLCARHPGAFQSAEDLTNLGGTALQQNLATVTTLGCDDVEMNGHHYFAGLQHLDPAEARALVAAHPDLYATTPFPRMEIADGSVVCASVHGPGFGVAARADEEGERV